ncbi:hypothetical protein Taro_054678 [Colocasia esculenta]|uniref:Uncharacterized protein n=1 Tax=Colocasia esculenta TaxID=4460 RepID=A0A843XPC3_COLES|nr:hypothetical protein [Colocasia esculenta]
MVMKGAALREVWATNVMEETALIAAMTKSFPFIAVDTELSDFLRHPPRFASMKQLYQDVKHNVEGMELEEQIDLERNRDEDVDVELLSDLLLGNGCFDRRPGRTWVTFHRIYDLAYLVTLLSHSLLLETLISFALLIDDVLNSVVDTKYIVRSCREDFGTGDLRLLRILRPGPKSGQARGPVGPARPIDSPNDSLVTAMAFERMIHNFPHLLEEELEVFVWGMESCKIE